jgi:hypothetical protein
MNFAFFIKIGYHFRFKLKLENVPGAPSTGFVWIDVTNDESVEDNRIEKTSS